MIYIFSPTEPNNLRAFINACLRSVFLATRIDPVLSSVLEAAAIAVTHLFPDFLVLVVLVLDVLVLECINIYMCVKLNILYL